MKWEMWKLPVKVCTFYFHQMSMIHPRKATHRFRIAPLTIVSSRKSFPGAECWVMLYTIYNWMLGNAIFGVLNGGRDQEQFKRKGGEIRIDHGQRRFVQKRLFKICFNLSLTLKFERVIRIGSQTLKTRNHCRKEGKHKDASHEHICFADIFI